MLRQNIVAFWWVVLVVCVILRLWANYAVDILTTWERPGAGTAAICGTCVNFVLIVTLISRILASL